MSAAVSEHAERPAWMEKPKPVTQGVKGLALVVTVLVVIVPFWVVIATSFAPDKQVIANGGYALWPDQWTTHAYDLIFSGGQITRAMLVSGGITVVGTAFSLTCTVMLAYALARPNVVGGKPVMLMILFTFLFPAGMIPSFLVVNGMGLRNTYWALFLPVLISAFNLVVTRGFFQGIPAELFESAKIDGAGELRTLVTIVLPLSKAVVAVVGLFYAVGYWNDFFRAILYTDQATMWPLQTWMRTYVVQSQNSLISVGGGVSEQIQFAPQTVNMAVVVLATVPILCVYPFIQRYFTKGVLTGAIKS
ncbi:MULTISPECIES: carbohydrate ABC transporter permease [unclassified Streptomyces]|uniref:carbohydrate ABC transporter permease n=1 Tax=unclassified Streptomyces TaxID=2593676 RepID=UPI0029BB3156|nr:MULTISPECIES: carbohydrate ABC transporter permease [unclassified Streptomyces]MDX3768963.1 carbohydrate ABC transporter permease [Streptomyces sp. AK08-01B]MDX3815633.1 carbohydrate ABC transporter permease [Streptomyces sp. AK08-01A]